MSIRFTKIVSNIFDMPGVNEVTPDGAVILFSYMHCCLYMQYGQKTIWNQSTSKSAQEKENTECLFQYTHFLVGGIRVHGMDDHRNADLDRLVPELDDFAGAGAAIVHFPAGIGGETGG